MNSGGDKLAPRFRGGKGDQVPAICSVNRKGSVFVHRLRRWATIGNEAEAYLRTAVNNGKRGCDQFIFSSIGVVNARMGTEHGLRREILTNWSDIIYQGVWLGVEGEMELKDRFYAPAAPTTIFGNRLISFVSTVGDTPLTLFPRYYLLHSDYL